MLKFQRYVWAVLITVVFVLAATCSEANRNAPFKSPPERENKTAAGTTPGNWPDGSAMYTPAQNTSTPAPTVPVLKIESPDAPAGITPKKDTSAPPAAPTDTQADFPENIKNLPAASEVDVSGATEETLKACFYAEAIPDAVFADMQGKSYKKGCPVKRKDLRYVRVLHMGFDGKTHIGELVVNKSIAADIVEIFFELYRARYPIEKMVRVDRYNADDYASMADNNTSAFNCRRVEGGKGLSRHAYGLAIDINPLYNPYVKTLKGKKTVLPKNGAKYADRRLACRYYIKKKDFLCRLFAEHGFAWGGNFKSLKDYQHFQIAK